MTKYQYMQPIKLMKITRYRTNLQILRIVLSYLFRFALEIMGVSLSTLRTLNKLKNAILFQIS